MARRRFRSVSDSLRNVYVFRFDWLDDKIVSWEEYANPITILRTFPDQYRNLIEGLLRET